MAASFFVFAAWASASGRLTQWVSLATHDDLERPAVSAPIPDPEPEPEPVAVPEPAPEPEPAPSPPPAKKLPAVVPAPADVDALYRAAHDAHFVRRDPAAALAGWDRYLAAAGPGGRFTLEARYNRAISLVRLGRRAEAAAALRPFANGEYGGYRRAAAAQLLRPRG